MIDRSVLANPALWLEPANDGRHALRDAPLMRESIPYVLSLPEAGIAAFVYTWVDRQNVAGYACAIYGPGVANGPIVGRMDGVAVGADTNFDNWKVGPFELNQDLKMDKARVRWMRNSPAPASPATPRRRRMPRSRSAIAPAWPTSWTCWPRRSRCCNSTSNWPR